MNKRPDQKKFDKFVQPLIELDPIWEHYKKKSEFVLEVNPYRKPGRMLKKLLHMTNCTMTYTIELYLEPIWFEIEYSNALPYTFATCAFCDTTDPKKLRWKVSQEIIKHEPLNIINKDISNYFEQAFFLINKWTLEYVKKNGQLSEFESTGWKQK